MYDRKESQVSGAAKRDRMRLAKAELLMHLAVTALSWQRQCENAAPGALPFEDWPPSDPFVALARTYGLTRHDLARLLDRIGDELEGRALRGGYDDHWDEAEASPIR